MRVRVGPEAKGEAEGEGRGALERLLVDARGDDERRRALEAGELARLEQLDVARDGVLGDARLEPRLPELVARCVDAHPRLCLAGGDVGRDRMASARGWCEDGVVCVLVGKGG